MGPSLTCVLKIPSRKYFLPKEKHPITLKKKKKKKKKVNMVSKAKKQNQTKTKNQKRKPHNQIRLLIQEAVAFENKADQP